MKLSDLLGMVSPAAGMAQGTGMGGGLMGGGIAGMLLTQLLGHGGGAAPQAASMGAPMQHVPAEAPTQRVAAPPQVNSFAHPGAPDQRLMMGLALSQLFGR